MENWRIGEFDFWCHEQVIVHNSRVYNTRDTNHVSGKMDPHSKKFSLTSVLNNGFTKQILCNQLLIRSNEMELLLIISTQSACQVILFFKLSQSNLCKLQTMKLVANKVYIFWEGHKILQNLHLTFDWHYLGQKLGEDFAKLCGLLRIYEL